MPSDSIDASSFSLWWWLIISIFLLAGGASMLYLMNKSRENKRRSEGSKEHRKRNDAVDDAFGAVTTPARLSRDIKFVGADINKGAKIKPHDGGPEVKVRSRVELPPQGSGTTGPVKQSWVNNTGAQQDAPPRVEPPAPAVDVQQALQGRGPLARRANVDFESELKKLEGNVISMRAGLDGMRAEYEMRINNLAKANKAMRDELGMTIAHLREELEKKFRGDINAVMNSLVQFERELRKVMERGEMQRHESAQQIDELRRVVESGEKQDGVYAKVIGTILLKSEQALGDEAFGEIARAAGEQEVSAFLREGEQSADGLEDLQKRADAIHASLRAAVGQMCAVNSEAGGKLGPYVRHIGELSSELRQLQEHLKSGNLKMTASLEIPVEAQPGARTSFLEELSQAVRREVDKWRNPRGHWESELDRFVRNDVVSVVDACDKEVTEGPGKDTEIEECLRSLFEEAGLRQILPKQGEPFKPAEQNLTQKVGDGGPKDRIARVTSRGFYFLDGGKEQLIRKASVEVYG